MNSIRILFLTLLAGMIFYACMNKTSKNNSAELIRVNPHEVLDFINLSELAESVRCVKLQTDSNDIIGRAREVLIRDKYIYVRDIAQQTLFVFDKNGKFVSKLNKRGQGPDEYLLMGPVFVDEEEEYVEVINLGRATKLKYTNITFKLIESVPFSDLNYNSCKRNNGVYFFATQQLQNIVDDKKTNAGLIIVDAENNLEKLFEKSIETKNSSFSPNIECFAENEKNELFVSLMYDNTFYQLNDGGAHPILSVDFGKYGMDNNIGLESMEKQMIYVKAMNGLASFPVLNMNNDKILSFSYYFKQDESERMYREKDFRQYIKMKKTNKVYHVKKIKNDITDFPEYVYISSYFFTCAHDVWYKDYLVDVILPSYYFLGKEHKEEFSNEIGVVTAEDNPIIVMMKLKK